MRCLLHPLTKTKTNWNCNGGPLCVNNALIAPTLTHYVQFGNSVEFALSIQNNSTSSGVGIIRFEVSDMLQYQSAGSSAWVYIGTSGGNNIYEIQCGTMSSTQTLTYTFHADVAHNNTSSCIEELHTQAQAHIDYPCTTGLCPFDVSENTPLYLVPDYISTIYTTMNASTIGASLSGSPVFMDGILTIDNTFMIDCEMMFSAGSGITVSNGNVLTVDNAVLESACFQLWRGILLEKSAKLELFNSTLLDAHRGVELLEDATLFAKDNIFRNNHTGIYSRFPVVNNPNTVNITLLGNHIFDHIGNSMLLPYAGMTDPLGNRPFAGIDVTSLTLSLQHPCEFLDLNMGIFARNSTLDIKSCHFEGIRKVAAYNANPASIFFNGAAIGASSCDMAYLGNGGNILPANPADIEDSDHGIVTTGTELVVEQSTMEGIREFGIRYAYAKLASATIEYSSIETDRVGISLEFCETSPSVLVFRNDIVATPILDDAIGAIGIQVLEGGIIPDNVELTSNGVTMFRPGNGIWLNSCNNTFLTSNVSTIMPVVTQPIAGGTNCFSVTGGTGVRLIACNRASSSSAQINTSLPADQQHTGFRVENSTNWRISCNLASTCQNGFLFQGVSVSTDNFISNEMTLCYTGLVVNNGGNMGDQNMNDNQWGAVFGSGFGARNDNTFGNSYFTVNEIQPCNQSDKYFPVWSAPNFLGWFTATPCMQSYTPPFCPASIVLINTTNDCNAASTIASIASKQLSTEDYLTANNTPNTNIYPQEILAIKQYDLYRDLTSQPELLIDSVMAQFYANSSQTNIPAFLNLSEQTVTNWESVSANVLPLQNTCDIAIPPLKEELRIIDSLIQESHSDSLLGVRGYILQKLDSLRNFEQIAFASSMPPLESQMEILATQNASIAPSLLQENNNQVVNAIYLQTLGQEILEISTSQLAQLQTIALQCPLSGGNAVFQARSIVHHLTGTSFYNDTDICTQNGLIYKQGHSGLVTQALDAFRIYPNPTSHSITIEGQLENISIQLYNTLGQKIHQETLDNATSQTIDISFLPASIYFYEMVKDQQEVLQTGKLSIIR